MADQSTQPVEPTRTTSVSKSSSIVDWNTFILQTPLGVAARIDRACVYRNSTLSFEWPEVDLYCTGNCKQVRRCRVQRSHTGYGVLGDYQGPGDYNQTTGYPIDAAVAYKCPKCGRTVKGYVLRYYSGAASSSKYELVEVQKLAEWPPFSPPTPTSLIELIRPDHELYTQGRRAELRGLGIGAMAYYRRIIENQKGRLLDRIIEVAIRLGSTEEVLEILRAAKFERQFSRAMDSVRHAIPSVLFIHGHNPLTLLHDALSEDLHNSSDEDCLRWANELRLTLIAFAQKLEDALKDESELKDAVTRISARSASKKPDP